jgi:hypothetical protein
MRVVGIAGPGSGDELAAAHVVVPSVADWLRDAWPAAV